MGQEPVNWGSARSKKRYLSGRQSRPAPRSFWGPFQPSSCWASPLGGSAGAGARTGVKAGGRGPACSKLSLEEPVWALVLQLCHQRIFLGLAAAGFSVTQARFWRTAGDLAAGGGREEGKEALAVGGGWEGRLSGAGSQAAGRGGCGAPRWRGKQEGLPTLSPGPPARESPPLPPPQSRSSGRRVRRRAGSGRPVESPAGPGA